jgi:hypothetical protein
LSYLVSKSARASGVTGLLSRLPLMASSQQPLPRERRSTPSFTRNPGGGAVGFGCGHILGGLIAVSWWVEYETHLAWLVGIALSLAVLGCWQGDRSWTWVIPKLPWFT